MRNDLRAMLLAAAAGAAACSNAVPVRPSGAEGAAAATGGTAAASSTGPSHQPGGGFPPGPCGYPPPSILSPGDGAVVSGVVPLQVMVPEGPCNLAASTVLRIYDASGQQVAERCAFPFDPIRPWRTLLLFDGRYRLTAQRACSCTPCDETATSHVTVHNGHGPLPMAGPH